LATIQATAVLNAEGAKVLPQAKERDCV